MPSCMAAKSRETRAGRLKMQKGRPQTIDFTGKSLIYGLYCKMEARGLEPLTFRV